MALIVPDGRMEVKKSEALLKARYQLGELSLKLVSIIYSNVKRSDEIGKDYQIKVNDIAKLMGKSYGEMYNLLKEATDELLENPIKIEDKDKKKWVKFNWIADAQYENGIISFTISKRLKPFILDLQKKFLKYKLENILNLRGTYVIRLYEILKDFFNRENRYKRKAEITLSIGEIREMLEIPKSYQYSSHIKKLILEKAKEQFEKHTDIVFSYEEIKTGRKVTHIKFIILQNPAKIKVKKEAKRQLKNENDFKQFRYKLLKEAKDKIIMYNNIIFKIVDNLLVKEDKILSKEEAWDWWQIFFKNKDKLKVLDKSEFLKHQENKVKEIESIYKKIKELKRKYKYLVINFDGKDVEVYLSDIQVEDEKYKVFISVDNQTLIKSFENIEDLEKFLQVCSKAYRNLKK